MEYPQNAKQSIERSSRYYCFVHTSSRHTLLFFGVVLSRLTSRLISSLDAELAVVKKKSLDRVRSICESSISRASRCGFVNHAALASERAGQYFLEQQHNDPYWATHYLTNAHELYTDWTATAKVRQMEKTYESVMASQELALQPQTEGSNSFDGSTPVRRRQSNVSLTGRSRLEIVAQVEAKREGSWRPPAGCLTGSEEEELLSEALASSI